MKRKLKPIEERDPYAAAVLSAFDDMDMDLDGPYPGEECGRWRNGKLDKHCTKAGSEECDFECPYSR
jgi:hypothetical protein